MANKTVKVADILEYVNTVLERDIINDEVKGGLCSVIERVLMDTGNYKGFGYNVSGEHNNSRAYAVSNTLREEYRSLTQERRRNGGMR